GARRCLRPLPLRQRPDQRAALPGLAGLGHPRPRRAAARVDAASFLGAAHDLGGQGNQGIGARRRPAGGDRRLPDPRRLLSRARRDRGPPVRGAGPPPRKPGAGMKALRIFAFGGTASYRALFNWRHPAVYIPTMLGMPVFMLLFFTYLGR